MNRGIQSMRPKKDVHRFWSVTLLAIVASSLPHPLAAIDPDSNATAGQALATDPLANMPDAESGRLRQIVSDLVRQSIPENYVNEKDWGRKKKVYAGVSIRLDGWKLDTNRRWREVNHGAWTRYQIDLVDPDKNVQVDLQELNWMPDGRASFRIALSGNLHCVARRSRWNYGAQLWSLTVDADAVIQITINGSIGIGLDYANIPPDVLLKPVIESAQIRVPKFEVNRISHVGGDLAEGIGDALEGILRKEIVEKQQIKLVERMNQQISRNDASLRFSMSDWLSKLLSTKP